MIGTLTKDTFDPNSNYDEFYAGHRFQPFPEGLALKADEMLPRVGWALEVAKEIKAQTVLDLCCLDGFAALTLASKLGIEAVGVDLTEPGIALANERAQGLPAKFLSGAIEDYQGPQADLILLFEAIEHFADVDRVMDVIKAQLAPGGTLLVSTPDAEGSFGHGNKDECHLRIYSHKDDAELPIDTTHTKTKPTVSLPDYLRGQGFTIGENEVWNELIHIRATLTR